MTLTDGNHDSAMALVELGFAICEVAAPEGDGCSCRLGEDCPAVGKHPMGRGWMKTALRHRAGPNWRRHAAHHLRLVPPRNYGLIPPPNSGLMVIDRDDASVGLPMPETFEVHRASAPEGKGHYYFRIPDDVEEDDVPRAFAGGEIRVAGSGHVVGPGSLHASGDLYVGNDSDVAYADSELIDALRALPAVRRGRDGEVEAVVGSRHAFLTGRARKYRGWGWDAERIAEQLRADNDEYCTPPLDERAAEFDRIATWAEQEIAPDGAVMVRFVNNGSKNRHRRENRARPGWAR